MKKPVSRKLEPEEIEELGIRAEVELAFHGFETVEEKLAHDQRVLEDLRMMELEEERELFHRAHMQQTLDDLGLSEEDLDDLDEDDDYWGELEWELEATTRGVKNG